MGKLIRGPYSVKINDETIVDVEKFYYHDTDLYVTVLITDYSLVNRLLDKMKIDTITIIGAGQDTNIKYYVKKYVTGIDVSEMVARLELDCEVTKVQIVEK